MNSTRFDVEQYSLVRFHYFLLLLFFFYQNNLQAPISETCRIKTLSSEL